MSKQGQEPDAKKERRLGTRIQARQKQVTLAPGKKHPFPRRDPPEGGAADQSGSREESSRHHGDPAGGGSMSRSALSVAVATVFQPQCPPTPTSICPKRPWSQRATPGDVCHALQVCGTEKRNRQSEPLSAPHGSAEEPKARAGWGLARRLSLRPGGAARARPRRPSPQANPLCGRVFPLQQDPASSWTSSLF